PRLPTAGDRRATAACNDRGRSLQFVRLRWPERLPGARTPWRAEMIAAIAGRAWRTPLGGSIERVVSRWLAGEHAVPSAPHVVPGACQLRCAIPDQPAPCSNDRFPDRAGLLGLEGGRESTADSVFA